MRAGCHMNAVWRPIKRRTDKKPPAHQAFYESLGVGIKNKTGFHKTNDKDHEDDKYIKWHHSLNS